MIRKRTPINMLIVGVFVAGVATTLLASNHHLVSPAHAQASASQSLYSATGTPGIDYVPNQILVKFKPAENPATISSLVDERQDRGATLFGQIQNLQENAVIKLKGQKTPEEKLALLENTSDQVGVVHTNAIPQDENWYIVNTDGSISITEALQKYHSLGLTAVVQPNYIAWPDAIPNDTDYGKLWGMKKINAEAAWDVTKGSKNIKVAVVDSGVDPNHPDLKDNVIKAVSSDPDLDPKTRFCDQDKPFMPGSMHGSHVAGTIGGVGNNALGVAGVNWNVSILGYCAGTDNKGLSFAALAGGINQAVEDGAKVINLSLGSDRDDSLMHTAINNAVQRGVLVVVSSGNCGRLPPGQTSDRCKNGPACDGYVPANYPNVFTVAATGPNNERASYSSACAAVDITAPGGNPVGASDTCKADGSDCVRSTVPGGYANFAGTSMSSPHVAGLAALVWSVNPNLTAEQVRNIIETTATDLGPTGKDEQFGAGIINAQAAIQMAQQGQGGGTTPGAPVPTTPTPGSTTTTPAAGTPTPIPHPCPDKAVKGDYDCDNKADKTDETKWKDDFVKSATSMYFWEPIREQIY